MMTNFLRKQHLLLLLAILLLGLILLPCLPYFELPFDNPNGFEYSVVGLLLSIFLVMFILVQLTYSVHEIPRSIIQKYTIQSSRTTVFILYLAIAIFGSVYIVILPKVRFSYPLLTAIFASCLIAMIAFFVWFIRSTSVRGILESILKKTNKRFCEINAKEQDLKPEYDAFFAELEALNKKEGNVKCDTFSSILGFPKAHYTLRANKEGFIERINLSDIEQQLSQLLKLEEVEVIFEVYPSCLIPEKDPKSYPPIRNNHLLSITLTSNQIDERSKLKLIKLIKPALANLKEISNELIDDQLARIFEEYAQGVSSCFEINDRFAQNSSATSALNDYRQAASYGVTKQGEVDEFLNSLNEILTNQLYGMNQDVFLGLKRRESWEMSECVMDIISACLKTGNTEALRKIISQFYTLVYERFAEVKNPEILQDLFDVLSSTNRLYMRNARSYFCDSIALLPLNIGEFIGYNFLRQLKSEKDEKELARYFEPVIKAAINSSYAINLQNLRSFSHGDHPYGESYLRHQLQSFLKLLEFYPDHEVEWFPSHEEYWRMTGKPQYMDSADYKVMASKMRVIIELKKHLIRRVLELVLFSLYWFERGSLNPRIIQLYMLPAAKALTDGFGSLVLDVIQDDHWQNDIRLQLDTEEISPPGSYTPRLYNLNVFWIIFCIHSVVTTQQLLPPKCPLSQPQIDQLEAAVDHLALTRCLWAPALNITEQEFAKRLQDFKAEIEKIKPLP